MHCRKGQFVPRDIGRIEEFRFKAFGTSLKVMMEQSGTEEKIYLIYKREIHKYVWS